MARRGGPISVQRGKPCDPPADVPSTISSDPVAAETWHGLTSRSLKYDQNLKPANVKSITCAYFFVTEQAISATC